MGNSNILEITYPCFTLGLGNKKDRDVLHSEEIRFFGVKTILDK